MALTKQTLAAYSVPGSTGIRRRLKRFNWPLAIGSLLVLLLVLLAVKGPDWAPKNPMQENYTLPVNGQIVRPPYPPFEVEGFPLGTDAFGRDILSRLLWAVRPTLIMVTTVAAIRLVIGILYGLAVGWSNGLLGRALDSILSLALAIPVLIVALIGIAAVGIDRGLTAFIVGLALTGWAETARLVGEQTHTIKNQSYVEAAQALGGSDLRILFNHILRQVTPLVWMLMAFEVSATLLVVAELGFLGYYIGGGVWIEVTDFNAVNTAGLPELGQMLATALIVLTDPSALIAVGSVLFLAILGFNLLGEGLRRRLDPERMTARRPLFGLSGQVGDWIEDKISRPVTGWVEDHALQVGLALLTVLFVGGWSIWYRSRPVTQPVDARTAIAIPGGSLWASERRDMQGTRWVPTSGPASNRIAWKALVPGGPSGGPVITAQGDVVIAALDGFLIAFAPDGTAKWTAELPEAPVGTPAVGPGGEIYVVLQGGGLAAFSPEGDQQWRFEPQSGREATSGPVVASDGTIYYTRVDRVQAVSPQGESRWLMYAADGYFEFPPVLSAGESFLFLKNAALAADSGVPLELGDLPHSTTTQGAQFTDPFLFVGADGRTYMRSGHEVTGWKTTEAGVEMDPTVTWNYQGSVAIFPADAGVTPERLVWLFYSGDFGDTRMVWLDTAGKLVANTRVPARQGRMIGVDKDSVSYFCSSDFGINPKCFALELGAKRPRWEVDIDPGFEIVGGALAADRLYVASGVGYLIAIGEGQGGGK